MFQKFLFIILGVIAGFLISFEAFSAVSFPGGSEGIIADPSITITHPTGSDPIESTRNLGWTILKFAKMIVSGLALIYLVLIGVYMIVFSENEDRIKTQKKQITYALMGFLFLNIPGLMYQVFFSEAKDGKIIDPASPWSDNQSVNVFWDSYGIDGIFGNLIAFFQVLIFGLAVLTFTWGLFQLIVS